MNQDCENSIFLFQIEGQNAFVANIIARNFGIPESYFVK